MISRVFTRRTAAVLSALALTAGGAVLVAPSASASAAPKVTITSGPTVTGSSVSVGFSVNRQTRAVASCTYTLDGGTTNTSCGAPTSAPKVKPATYSVTATDLADGNYTFTVNVTLTDGGTASASSAFTVLNDPYPASRALCEGYGYTFVLGAEDVLWQCNGGVSAGTSEDDQAKFRALADSCAADRGIAFSWWPADGLRDCLGRF